ncbi:hypothetical protein VQL36_18580 [Chengkuizengella sp. SCS-71B]|uniref:hypothetical protein n=1 Tax=Chengkuizengella sp. SCS-71B TaxID=3115290 RepID=UPI0032C22503
MNELKKEGREQNHIDQEFLSSLRILKRSLENDSSLSSHVIRHATKAESLSKFTSYYDETYVVQVYSIVLLDYLLQMTYLNKDIDDISKKQELIQVLDELSKDPLDEQMMSELQYLLIELKKDYDFN